MSIENVMSLSDGIGCVRKRLNIYEQNIVSDQDMSTDSNGGQVVDIVLDHIISFLIMMLTFFLPSII